MISADREQHKTNSRTGGHQSSSPSGEDDDFSSDEGGLSYGSFNPNLDYENCGSTLNQARDHLHYTSSAKQQ